MEKKVKISLNDNRPTLEVAGAEIQFDSIGDICEYVNELRVLFNAHKRGYYLKYLDSNEVAIVHVKQKKAIVLNSIEALKDYLGSVEDALNKLL